MTLKDNEEFYKESKTRKTSNLRNIEEYDERMRGETERKMGKVRDSGMAKIRLN